MFTFLNSNIERVFMYIRSKEHVKYLEQIIKKGSNNRKHFLKTLKINKEYYGEKLSIGFSGKNKNENILAQVLQYSNKNIKNVGMYDGEIFNYKINIYYYNAYILIVPHLIYL